MVAFGANVMQCQMPKAGAVKAQSRRAQRAVAPRAVLVTEPKTASGPGQGPIIMNGQVSMLWVKCRLSYIVWDLALIIGIMHCRHSMCWDFAGMSRSVCRFRFFVLLLPLCYAWYGSGATCDRLF